MYIFFLCKPLLSHWKHVVYSLRSSTGEENYFYLEKRIIKHAAGVDNVIPASRKTRLPPGDARELETKENLNMAVDVGILWELRTYFDIKTTMKTPFLVSRWLWHLFVFVWLYLDAMKMAAASVKFWNDHTGGKINHLATVY